MRRSALCTLFRRARTPRAPPAVSLQRALAAHAPETRCAHCFITFATPSELAHHAAHFCFPDRPEEVLARFPPGSTVVDTVRGSAGEVLPGRCRDMVSPTGGSCTAPGSSTIIGLVLVRQFAYQYLS